MAAKISYKIGGSYDSKGEKNAIKGIKNITNAAKTFNTAVKGFVVAKVFEGITKVVSGSTESFKNQNKALQNYYKALSNNSKMTEKGVESLNKSLTKLSRNNFFDGDTLNNAAALASNLGLDANQIQAVMSAATDLTSAGIMPMDQAVKVLSQTYSGNTTLLKKYVPELGNLTAAELANGDAVSIIAEKYKGYADAMSQTFEGRDTQFKNTFGDLQAAVGSIGEAFKFVSEGNLMEPLNNITDWLVTNRDNILKFVTNLPDLIKASFDFIKNIIAKTFTFDSLKTLVSAFFKTLVDSIKDVGTYVYNVIINIGAILWNIIADFIDDVKTNLKNVFSNVGDSFKNILTNVLKSFSDLWSRFVEWVKSPFEKKSKENFDNAAKTTEVADVKAQRKSNEELNKTYLNDIGEASIDFTKSMEENTKTMTQAIQDTYSAEFEEYIEDLQEIMGKDLPDDLVKAMKASYKASGTSTASGATTETGSSSGSSTLDVVNHNWGEITNSFGEISSFVTDIATQNWGGMIADILSTIISIATNEYPEIYALFNAITLIIEAAVGTLVEAIAAVANVVIVLINPLTALLKSVLNIIVVVLKAIDFILEAIVNIVTAIVTPVITVVEVLVILVEVVGVIITILEPFLTAFTYLVKIVGIIVDVVAETIGNVLIAIYNGVIAVYNGIMDLFNFGNGKKAYKSFYTYSQNVTDIWNGTGFDSEALNQALATAASNTSSSSSSSSSATYSGTRDVTVNISYDHSYVNGDAREIALSIYDEIKAAEALGY